MLDARKKFSAHKSNAKRRGIEFNLTFDEWKQIWLNSGKWDQRGRGAEKYCMCRIGDKGAYSVENVFIGQGKHNVSEGNIGKPDSPETKLKKSQAAKGKKHPWSAGDKNPMHRPDVKVKVSQAICGENHYNHKGVVTPFGYFVTTKVAANSLCIKKSTVEWRCRHNKLGFSYAIA
jgi:hypothetical protein